MKGGVYPTKYGWQVRYGKLTKRFKKHEKEKAEYFLNGLRYKDYEGTFDIRDYRQDQPLGFENLVKAYLIDRRHLKAVSKYKQRLRFGVEAWGNRNIKDIGYADLSALFNNLRDRGKSEYYIKHIRDCLRSFFNWLVDTDHIQVTQKPKMPKVKAHAALRKVLRKSDQSNILDEIYRLSWNENPKIYIGCLWLSTYINIRPSELINIKEKHIDLSSGTILIPNPKEGEPKYVYLLPEDIETVDSFGKSFPELYFFRHIKGKGGAKPNGRFGVNYLHNWWRKACKNLNIDGVSLYPGTRHTSAIDMRTRTTPEAVKRATGHKNNRAFERYLQVTGDELRSLYADTRTDNKLITISLAVNDDK
jgi:integrase